MRQEPKLSDLDSLDEAVPSPAAPVNARPTIQKRGMGFFPWLLLLIALGGVAGLGYWNLNLHGSAQSQGQNQSLQLGSIERRFDELQERFEQQGVALAQQSLLAKELQERLDLVSGQGISGNAASIDRLEAQIIQVDKATQRQSGRLDTLIDELGQSKDQDQNLDQQVGELRAELQNQSTLLSGFTARLQGQSDRMDAQDERIAAVPSLLSAGEVQIERLLADVQQIRGQLTVMDERIALLGREIELGKQFPTVDVEALALDVAELQRSLGDKNIELRELSDRLSAVDQFRQQTNQTLFRLEDGIRALQ